MGGGNRSQSGGLRGSFEAGLWFLALLVLEHPQTFSGCPCRGGWVGSLQSTFLLVKACPGESGRILLGLPCGSTKKEQRGSPECLGMLGSGRSVWCSTQGAGPGLEREGSNASCILPTPPTSQGGSWRKWGGGGCCSETLRLWVVHGRARNPPSAPLLLPPSSSRKCCKLLSPGK